MKILAPRNDNQDLPQIGDVKYRETYTIEGTLTTGTGIRRLWFTRSGVITNVSAGVTTAPTGANLIFDVNKNGTTIFTGGTGRPEIVATQFSDLTNTPAVTSISSGDYLTVDVDQIGSTVAGAEATITIEWTQI